METTKKRGGRRWQIRMAILPLPQLFSLSTSFSFAFLLFKDSFVLGQINSWHCLIKALDWQIGPTGAVDKQGQWKQRRGKTRQRERDNKNPLPNSINCNPLGLMVYVCVGIIHLSMMLVPALRLLCVSERRKASVWKVQQCQCRDLNPTSLSYNHIFGQFRITTSLFTPADPTD